MMEIFYILNEHMITEVSSGGRTQFDLRELLQEDEEFGLEMVERFFQNITHSRKSRVIILLGQGWLATRFVNLPSFSQKNIKQILLHHLHNSYIEEIENINFDFFTLSGGKKQQGERKLVVYSAHKNVCDNLRLVLQKKHIELVGIYPYFHWSERNAFRTVEAETNTVYVCLRPHLGLIFEYAQGVLKSLSPVNFQSFSSAKESLDAIKQELKILELETDNHKLVCSFEGCEPYLKGEFSDFPMEDDASMDSDTFESLKETASRLRQEKISLNLLRTENAYIRDLYRSKEIIFKIAVVFVLSLMAIVGGKVISVYDYKNDLQEVNDRYARAVKEFIPEAVSTLSTTEVRDLYFKTEEEWEKRKEFMARLYPISFLFKHLSEIKQIFSALTIDKLEYRPRVLNVNGSIDNLKKYDSMKKQLRNRLPDYGLTISYEQQKEKVNFKAGLTQR